MTNTNPSLLVLLDLQNQFQQFENQFNAQLFSRFINKPECLQFINARLTNIRLVHFFLPNSEHTEIGADVVFFKTIYYIYCQDEETYRQMRRQYDNMALFVRILHIESLSRYLCQVAVEYFMEQAERTRHEPDEYDIALQTTVELVDRLALDLREHMVENTGIQPED